MLKNTASLFCYHDCMVLYGFCSVVLQNTYIDDPIVFTLNSIYIVIISFTETGGQ